jgi:dolichyl-phosphate-mannose--protein O-mannosyl transferase
MMRPTSFYFEDRGPRMEQILAIGNPAVFWGSLLAVPALFVIWRRARDWRAGFVAVPFVVQYVPWLLVGRPTFFFYVLPLVPLMVLAITTLLRRLSDVTLIVRDPDGSIATNPTTGGPAVSTANVYRPFVWIYVIAAVGLFVWFWPILTAGQISDLRYPTIVWFPNWI